MKEKLITVVVPVYNVAKYLDCCLSSIVNQTYRNLEIILVDDGSTDSSPNKCDDWGKRDQRVRVIHKENQGLGRARNTGIEHASGEYICFFDSDDYVDVRLIEQAYKKAETYEAEVVLFGLANVDENGDVVRTYRIDSDREVYSKDEVQHILLPDIIDSSYTQSTVRGIPFSACACFFSMKLIERAQWRFVSEREIISEDSYSLIELYKDVRKAVIHREILYYYRINAQSLSRSYRRDRFEKIKEFYLRAIELSKTCGYDEKIRIRIGSLFFNLTIDTMKQLVLSGESFRFKVRSMKAISEDRLLSDCLSELNFDRYSFAKRVLKTVLVHKMSLTAYLIVYIKAIKQTFRKK